MTPRKLSLERPSKVAASSRAAAARAAEEGTKSIFVEVPASLHRALKHCALERGMTVKALVLELLEREGIS